MAKPNKSTAVSPLQFDKTTAVMGKISNNLEKWGSEYVTAFTFPLEDIGLEREQVNRWLGPRTWESWFNVRAADQFAEPMDWLQALPDKGWIPIDHEFDIDDVELGLSGNRKAKFEAEEIEPKDGEGGGAKSKRRKRPGARLTKIFVKPTPGGIVQLACSLSVQPGLDDTNLLLQEHQMHPIKLTTGTAVLSEGAPKQAELQMAPGTGKPAGNPNGAASPEAAAAIHRAFEQAPPGPNEKPTTNGKGASAPKSGDVADFEKGARKKVAEHASRSPRGGGKAASRPGRH